MRTLPNPRQVDVASILALIEKKKRCQRLTEGEIRQWIQGLVNQEVPDYQTAALLMAIRLNGMDFDEISALTRAMTESGERLQFPGYPHVLDKHSTGGVGDKVTLVLAPLMASMGAPVAMLSGRGLGFSGGTIDKFEALEGVRCEHDAQTMQRMLKQVGWANAQASNKIAPADKILYNLRGVTGTVDSLPLITASIMSKKLAGGATHLCLDVKCGQGAFMPGLEEARNLAQSLKRVGESGGLVLSGLISRMDEPLGRAVGNYVELLESVIYLKTRPDTPLMQLIESLASRMLQMADMACDDSQARNLIENAFKHHRPLDKLVAYLEFSGAKPSALQELLDDDFQHHPRVAVTSERTGVVQAIDSRRLAFLGMDLGAGRKTQDDVIDPMAGFYLEASVGEAVSAGEPLLWAYGQMAQTMSDSMRADMAACFQLTDEETRPKPIILDVF